MKIGWIPQSYCLDDPTARTRCFQIYLKLRDCGYESEIIKNIDFLFCNDIIITQVINPVIFEKTDASIILDWCDGFIPENQKKYLNKYKYLIAGCREANQEIFDNKGVVIETSVKGERFKKDYTWNNRIVWMGSSPQFTGNVLEKLSEKGWNIIVIGPLQNKMTNIVWQLETWEEEVIKSDIAIIPYPPKTEWDKWKNVINIRTKDNERAAEFMSLGLPLITSPLDSYRFIEHEKDGFFADSFEEFEHYLNQLKNKIEYRKEIGEKGKQKALSLFSIEKIIRKYEKLLK